VSPAGDVLPCSSFRPDEGFGNLLRQPFGEVWQAPSARYFREKRMMPASCAGCAKAAFCQGACTLYWREVGTGELTGRARCAV
jgi:radical SAM protein with 4Fe4S-binding SPASM domain